LLIQPAVLSKTIDCAVAALLTSKRAAAHENLEVAVMTSGPFPDLMNGCATLSFPRRGGSVRAAPFGVFIHGERPLDGSGKLRNRFGHRP
jgi:hypothetical protein